ncbi:MAG: hypothetical protein U0441_15205 [Polyangiaceae bacterium]
MQGGYGGGYGGGAPGGGGGWGPPPGGAPPGGAPPGGAPPGGFGGPPPGGYGAPPGAPPPGGGYGAPPPGGGGFGGPPGGGWAPPPQGGAPGGGGFNPYGAPAGGPQQTGAGRFFKTAAIGGAIGGVLSAIPLLGALNCCFCLLVQGGSIIGVNMYLKENPQERLSSGDAATSGAMSGAIAGVIAGVLQMLISLITGGAANMAQIMRQLPPDVARSVGPLMMGGASIIGIIISVIIFTAFGALGGFLGMTLFFKDRAR